MSIKIPSIINAGVYRYCLLDLVKQWGIIVLKLDVNGVTEIELPHGWELHSDNKDSSFTFFTIKDDKQQHRASFSDLKSCKSISLARRYCAVEINGRYELWDECAKAAVEITDEMLKGYGNMCRHAERVAEGGDYTRYEKLLDYAWKHYPNWGDPFAYW